MAKFFIGLGFGLVIIAVTALVVFIIENEQRIVPYYCDETDQEITFA